MKKRWTAREDAVLRAHYADTLTKKLLPLLPGRSVSTICQHAYKLGLHKSEAYLATPDAGRLQKGENVGLASRFLPGHRSWNTGLKGWTAGGRSAKTRFKKGQDSKRWDATIYTIGALRINSDGTLDIKVKNGLRAWVAFRRYVWESERGPIPKGFAVRTINGDPDDTRIENLRLAPLAELMRENTIHNYPKPIARAVQLRGALMRHLNRLERERAENA